MKVCYFGSYQKRFYFPRNRNLIDGLKNNGVEVVEIESQRKFFLRTPYLLIKYFFSLPFDAIVVGVPGNEDVLTAKFISWLTGAPVVYDSLISVFDTKVYDRKLVKNNSLKARWYFLLDWLPLKLADLILVDTNEHAKFFAKTFGISKSKMFRLWVGADYQVFRPTKKTKQQFVAYYHGKFIPLHGVDVIVEAAKVLENKGVEFRLLGGGQLEAKIKTKVKKLKLNKIKFLSKVDYIELPKYALQASVFLAGPFGTTSKARRVIPNKIFEALGMGLPTIVGDTKATRELLTDKEVIFVNPGDSKELAKKILWVKNNFGKAKIIAKKGRAKIKKESSPKVLGKKLKEKLNELIH